MSFKEVDTSLSYRCQSHPDEEVGYIERALASFLAAVAKDYELEEAARPLRIGSQYWRKPVRMSIPTAVLSPLGRRTVLRRV